MSIVRITSWNAQGDAVSKISQNYDKILPSKTQGYTQTDIDNIMLIQEAGATYNYGTPLVGDITLKFGKTDYSGHFSQHEEALNKRCTTGIIASYKACSDYSMQIFHITPDAVKRPVVIALAQFKYFSLYIVTVHATANHHVSGDEIKAVIQNLRACSKAMEWQYLFMGDFNITPKELVGKGDIPAKNIIFTGSLTQKSGNELDYAIASDKLVPYIKIAHANNYYNSDHLPVYIELDTAMPL